MIVLALESSCDETAVAILCEERGLLCSEIASQISIHTAYGGVVPEVASRSHLHALRPVIDKAFEAAGVRPADIDAVAATAGPGLATSLMIGMSAAKGVALGLGKPFLAINHMEGHLLSPYFPEREIPPSVGLIVSGGHTMLVDIAGFGRYRLLGETHDDAAGEAFDKVGKLMGLPYPAGPVIDRLSATGDRSRFAFPRSMLDSGDFHFSFSGLKTAVRYTLDKLPGAPGEWPTEDLCASFQEAVVDVLVAKSLAALRATGRKALAVSGGVSCNRRLRERMREACTGNRADNGAEAGLSLHLCEPYLSTDNAAMIAYVALGKLRQGERSPLTADIDPNLKLKFEEEKAPEGATASASG